MKLKTITVSRNEAHEIICADCGAKFAHDTVSHSVRFAHDITARTLVREAIRDHLATYHPDATGAQYWTRETITATKNGD